jgi:hypothetical protein
VRGLGHQRQHRVSPIKFSAKVNYARKAGASQKFHHTATAAPRWLLVLTVQTVENTPA